MTEYDCLLKVEYFIYSLFDSSEKNISIYGTKQIPDLYAVLQGKRLVVSLDQATNKTGVCILDFDTRNLIAVLDLINTGFPSKQLYFESIYDFLANHIRDADIVHFIYEIPIEHSKNMQTLALLEAMRAFIKNFRYRMPSLSDKNMVEIYVSAWRGHFLADKKYAGKRKTRNDAKESTRVEVCTRFPDLAEFAYRRAEPPDSCDAVGIALGALKEMYSDVLPGYQRVNKTMLMKNVKTKYDIKCGRLPDLLELLKTEYFMHIDTFSILEFNGDMTLEENVKRYCGSRRNLGILLVPLSDIKTIQLMKWETGKALADNEYYAIFCRRL